MAFTFEQLLAADPSNPANIAQNSSITIFAPGDATMAPLTITDPDGSPLPNPFNVNANGFGPAFAHATLDRVAWSGGGFTGFVTSYEGMKGEAVAARQAAETAAAEAAAAAQADLEARIAAGNFKGDKGADGSNVLPTDTAIRDAIANPASLTRGELSATILDVGDEAFAKRVGDPTAPAPDVNRHRAHGPLSSLAVPTPDGTSQATHPDALFIPQGFAGYNWWMVYTPYANASDPLENPCIVQSRDGITWTVPVGLTNPIEPYPGGADYNSDAILVLSHDGSTLYCIFRQVIAAQERIVYKSTTDGVNWTPKQTIFTTATLSGCLSPAIVWNGTEWVMISVEGNTQGSRKLQKRTSANITGPWSAPVNGTITLPATFSGLAQEPWHVDVVYQSGYYVAIVNGKTLPSNGSGENTLAYSRDGITWQAATKPVIRKSGQAWDNAQYRATLVPLMDGRFRIYYGGVTADSLGWRIGVTETQLDSVVTPEGRRLLGKRDIAPNGVMNIFQEDGTVPALVLAPQDAAQASLVTEFRDKTGSVLYGGVTAEGGLKLGGYNGTKFNAPGLGVGGYAEFQGHAWFGTTATRSMWLGLLADTAGGQRVFAIANANVAPTATPGNGGVLYAEGGALKWKGSAGTVTVIAPA